MKEIGGYCKAYTARDYRRYQKWIENPPNLTSEKLEGGSTAEKGSFGDDDILYLQENFTVTRGIYLNEDIVFDQVTPEWIDFCQNTLSFKSPAESDVQ